MPKYQEIYNLTLQNTFRRVESSLTGLTTNEASRRLAEKGLNEFSKSRKNLFLLVLLGQFKNWLVVLLLLSSVISVVLGDTINAYVILGVIVLSVSFGLIQEYKAEKTLLQLTRFISHKATVLRDNKWIEIDSRMLTIGDVVKLHIGDKIAADLRLIEVDRLSINEASLTGESYPVVKTETVLENRDLPVEQRINMAFAGSNVVSGNGKGVVVAIGKDTQMGNTAKLLEVTEAPTEFQVQMTKFSSFLFKVILVLTLFVFMVNAWMGKGNFTSFQFALALAVGVTPELLPMITTVTMSKGSLLLAKKKVIVKKLVAVENLGNIDILCTDKTGTLTEGNFKYINAVDDKGDCSKEVLTQALLCSGIFSENNAAKDSNPLDAALAKYIEDNKNEQELNDYRLLDENEFDFERRRMSVVVAHGKDKWLIVKGSPEAIFAICKSIPQRVIKLYEKYERQGFRVIALAKKRFKGKESEPSDENELIFKGFLLYEDPLKPDVVLSLNALRKHGIAIKILSGDSPVIVKKIALDVGLTKAKGKVVLGEDLVKMSDSDFLKAILENNLFARVTPSQKFKIVERLNASEHTVGYLGDGINDAPALKIADVGIAVDTGSEVAKEASDIVLLKKDLSVLVDGIEIGRKTFGNIMKYILNTISANYGNMLTVAISSLFLPFIPLLPSQILLNNFISDIPLLALATDNVDTSFLRRPKKWNIKLIGIFMAYFGIISSLFDIATIVPMVIFWKVNPDLFRTVWFVESSLSEILVTFSIRTHKPFISSIPGRWLLLLSVFSSLFIIILPFVPVMQIMFKFTPIPFYIMVWIVLVLITYVLVTELLKRYLFSKFEM